MIYPADIFCFSSNQNKEIAVMELWKGIGSGGFALLLILIAWAEFEETGLIVIGIFILGAWLLTALKETIKWLKNKK